VKATLLLVTLALYPATLAAQAPGRVEIAAGVRFTGAEGFPATPSAQSKLGGSTRDVFITETEIAAFPAADVRLGFSLTSALQIEGAAAIGATDISTNVTHDVEGVSNTSSTVPMTHYGFEGSLVARLRRFGSARLTPLITGGAGYFRQVQDGGVLVVTGRSYHVGGGGDYRWRSTPQARIRASGLRVDVRLLVQQDGLADEGDARMVPAFGAWFYMRF